MLSPNRKKLSDVSRRIIAGGAREAVEARQRALADFRTSNAAVWKNESGPPRPVEWMSFDRCLACWIKLISRSPKIPKRFLWKRFFRVSNWFVTKCAECWTDKAWWPLIPSPVQTFDAHHHQAVVHEPSDDVAEGRIIRRLQIGWVHGDMVLRPAVVAVSSGVPSESD